MQFRGLFHRSALTPASVIAAIVRHCATAHLEQVDGHLDTIDSNERKMRKIVKLLAHNVDVVASRLDTVEEERGATSTDS